jgi:hypothetical protein
LLTLRRRQPNQYRAFKLPFPTVWSYVAFYICTLLTYWSGWEIISKMCVAMFLGFLVMLGNFYFRPKSYQNSHPLNWRESSWIWPYFVGIGIFSYCGTFGSGIAIIPFGLDLIYLAVFCLAILFIAVRYSLPSCKIQEYIQALDLPTQEINKS